MDLYKALESRRSVRKYKSDEFSEGTLRKILEAARIAPSWSNLQCWRFIVVRSVETKKELAASMPDNNPAKKAVGETAPVVIVLCADPKESGDQDGKGYFLLDAGLAMQQMMLAAHAEGLGTCWVGLFDEGQARKACSVPKEYRVVGLTPLGYPEKQPSARPRKELTDIIFNEKWGRPFN